MTDPSAFLSDPVLEKKIKTDLDAVSLKYSLIYTNLVFLFYPLWGVLSYFYLEEDISVIITFLKIAAVHCLFTILVVFLTKKFSWKSLPINYGIFLGMSIQIAYTCNITRTDSGLFMVFLGYSSAFIIAGIFFVWKYYHALIVLISSLTAYVIFFFTVSSHTVQHVFNNGALFCFTVAVACTIYSGTRYSQTKNDITAKIMISKANDQLKELDRAKTDFFTNISHEFRTPLTLILGPIDVMLDNMSPKNSIVKYKDDVRSMKRNALRLLRLVNNLLDFSRIEAGRMEPKFSRTDIAISLKHCISTLESAIKAKNITLDSDIDEPALYLYVDREMFDKIIMNLLSNAYKFTSEGGRISIKAGEEGYRIFIRISDTGAGIPGDKLSTIFDRFSQVDGSTKRRHEGTGIGLSLVKELVNIHKGDISVESEAGKGTAFTIYFKKGFEHLENERVMNSSNEEDRGEIKQYLRDEITVESTYDVTTKENVPNNDAKILIVEDNHDMVQFLSSILRDRYAVHTAYSGREGLEKIKETSPDLILSDVMMPEMDGYELVEHIRKDDKTIPVILLTAKADIPDKLRGFRKGANDYIAKPFNKDELCARINAQLKFSRLRKSIAEKQKVFTDKKKNLTEITKMKIEKIREYIMINYRDDITREDLAEIAEISPDHLSRMFVQHTGEKLKSMINRLRVEYAAQKIEGTDQKIIDIALEAGFNELKTFNMAFQKVKSVSPSEYRKNHYSLK